MRVTSDFNLTPYSPTLQLHQTFPVCLYLWVSIFSSSCIFKILYFKFCKRARRLPETQACPPLLPPSCVPETLNPVLGAPVKNIKGLNCVRGEVQNLFLDQLVVVIQPVHLSPKNILHNNCTLHVL